MASELIKVTGLWEAKDKNGNMMLSGSVGPSLRIVIFTNIHKEEFGKGPDYNLYVTKNEPKPEG